MDDKKCGATLVDFEGETALVGVEGETVSVERETALVDIEGETVSVE